MFLFHFKKVKILVGQLSFEKTQIEHTNKNTNNTNVKNLHTSPQKTKKKLFFFLQQSKSFCNYRHDFAPKTFQKIIFLDYQKLFNHFSQYFIGVGAKCH